MMTKFRTSGAIAVVVAGALGLSACKDRSVELVILHTNDIHSQLHPVKSDEFRLGGLARMSTLLTQLRGKHARSITLDAGDWSEGSWYFSVDAGANMLRIFDALGVAATCVGNHDYLAGPDGLKKAVEEANPTFPVLAENLDLLHYPNKDSFRKRIPGTAILERDGIKIGIIGLTTVDYPYASYLKPVIATEPVKAAQEAARILRPKVDILIILSHNFFTTNAQIARSVSGVDAVISGHSHHKTGRAVLVQNAGRQVPVVEAASWGRFVGELKMRFDASNRRIGFVGYRLHPVSETLEDEPVVAELVRIEDKRLADFYGGDIHEIVAHSEVDLDHEDNRRASLGNLAAKSYRDATGADVGLEAEALTGVRIAKGPVTVFDFHDVVPHIMNFETGKEWTVKSWYARGQDLALINTILFSGVNLFAGDRSGIVAMDGMQIVWRPKGEGSSVPQVLSTKVGEKPLDPTRRYHVALTDGLLLALNLVNQKLHLGLDMSELHETGIEAWRAVLGYGRKLGTITAEGIRSGGRTFTTTADPAIFGHGITFDSSGLLVQVVNDGLSTLDSARLECQSGIVDDAVSFGTDQQVFTPIGAAEIPRLDGGESALVHISWQPTVAGRWPVRCQVYSAVDGDPGNSHVSVVLKVAQ